MSRLAIKKTNKADPSQSNTVQRRRILSDKSSFYVQEAYKTLRTNIRFSLSTGNNKKFCITSSLASEGKSITILNLAISFAQSGQKVLLIDGDLRRPNLARLLIEKSTPGLSNILAGLCKPEDGIRREVYPNLDIIFSGEIPPNPSELLGSPRMKQLIDAMSDKYDYILMDTPPVDIVSDACVIANVLDGVLYLVRLNQTEKDAVAMGVRQLELSGANLMGFVMNGTEQEGVGHYGRYGRKKYRYGYRYGYRYRYGYGYKYKYSYESANKKEQK